MATQIETLFQQFLKERKYLRNVRPDTIDWYECAWKAFKGSATHCLTDPNALKRSDLDQFIFVLRDRGVKPVTCNTWLKALNAFFRWLHENGHVTARVHMPPLKVEKRLVQTLDGDAIHAIVNFKLPTTVTVGCAARKVGQYAAQEVSHLRGLHSTLDHTRRQ